MRGAISPLPQYAFMAWCLVKHRDNFTLPLPLHLHIRSVGRRLRCLLQSECVLFRASKLEEVCYVTQQTDIRLLRQYEVWLWYFRIGFISKHTCTLRAWRRAPESFRELYGHTLYEGEPKNFRTGRLGRELQMVQLSITRCSCIAILWVSLVSFAPITLCVASQRAFIVLFISFVKTQSGNFWIHPLILIS
jgi:hypothetical protein